WARGGTNGGPNAIDAATREDEAASGPSRAGATSTVVVVPIPEGSFTAACAAVCECFFHGCATNRSPAANARQAASGTATTRIRTSHRAEIIACPSAWRKCNTAWLTALVTVADSAAGDL